MNDLLIEHWHYQGWRGTQMFARRAMPVTSPIGGVLVIHGYAEHGGRHQDSIQALVSEGYAVLAPDLRGHGRSPKVHGDLHSLEGVMVDLARLGDHLQQLAPGKPLFILAHSMGALLSINLLAREQRWAGAVLNGTPLKVPERIPLLVQKIAKLLANVTPLLPLQGYYDATRGCRDPKEHETSRADPFQYKGKMRARTGAELLKALTAALDALPKIKLPVLVTHGGEDETVVLAASGTLHANLGAIDKEFHIFDGLKHEVHREPERAQVIHRWVTWIKRHTKESSP